LQSERFPCWSGHTIGHEEPVDGHSVQTLSGRSDKEAMAGQHREILCHTAGGDQRLDRCLERAPGADHIVYYEGNTTADVTYDPLHPDLFPTQARLMDDRQWQMQKTSITPGQLHRSQVWGDKHGVRRNSGPYRFRQ
jgi:hypothetical protein